MILIIHDAVKVIRIITQNESSNALIQNTIGETLFEIANQFPMETIAWCNECYVDLFNSEVVPDLLHHDKMILSFEPNETPFLGNGLGYVDHASILKINKQVSFFTWQLSSAVGVAKAVLLNAINPQVPNKKENFDYMLQSLAKIGLSIGLFCYSEPKLLLLSNVNEFSKNKPSNLTLFRFVKQHINFKWTLILLFNMFIYEKKIPLFSFIAALFYKTRKWDDSALDHITIKSKKKVSVSNDIDVIVPTIGRSEHVYNVLCDLRNQTHLPKKVIVVEQNPKEGSISELDFLYKETWPFAIDHTFTHQPGACNARNIALSKTNSEWVFMCDDDNRFENDLIERVLANAQQYGVEAIITAYPRDNETIDHNKVHQTTIFGSGNSFVKKCYIDQVSYDANYELCYGEDFDFGMQLRQIGVDVVYFPKPLITHLKAPMGGFRIKPIFKWSFDEIQPIPSPTILLNFLKYRTPEQVNAYKTIYFFKKWKNNLTQNPFRFLNTTNLHWKASEKWAKKLQNHD